MLEASAHAKSKHSEHISVHHETKDLSPIASLVRYALLMITLHLICWSSKATRVDISSRSQSLNRGGFG